MNCTTQKNNLYDSVINEMEKITEYQKKLAKYGDEELYLLDKYNYDVDLIGFIHFHWCEIITDKMFRSFINIDQALDRCYQSIIKELNSREHSSASYSPVPFFELYRVIDEILDKRSRRKLYDKNTEKDIYSMSFLEYFYTKNQEVENYIADLDVESTRVSKEFLKEATDRCYKKLKDFMVYMKCELESRPYYEQTSVVIKNVAHVILMASNIAITVSID